MDFNLTDEQQMLRDAASRYVREQYGFEARRRLQAAGSASRAALGAVRRDGLAGARDPGGLSAASAAASSRRRWWPRSSGRALALEPYIGCAVLAARLIETADAPAFAAHRQASCCGASPPESCRSRSRTASRAAALRAERVRRHRRAPTDEGFVLDGTQD